MRKSRPVYPAYYHANSHNKAKDRRGGANFKRGKYKRQWVRTAANRRRKLLKHILNHPADNQALAQYKAEYGTIKL